MMENREWKKPGKRFFKKKNGAGGWYIPIEFNGEMTGWSDGHLVFLTFIPEDGVGNGPAKHLSPQPIELDRHYSGKFMKTRCWFNNPLRYICTMDDEEYGKPVMFFERTDGIRRNDWEYPVCLDDGYVNAIMYYARKMYKKTAKIFFFSINYDGWKPSKERNVPVLATVNDEPFAILMPVSNDIKISELRKA